MASTHNIGAPNLQENLSHLERIYEKQVQSEEYKIWKKNAPFLYDIVISHILEWHSLTVQWLPLHEVSADKDFSVFKLLVGTNAPKPHKNNLVVLKVKIPNNNVELSLDGYSYSHDKKDCFNAIGQSGSNIEIEKIIPHEGVVNRARCQPQVPTIIASKTSSGEVHIFNINMSYKTENPEAEIKLIGHTAEGYGLCWNPNKRGLLISGAKDSRVCLWDLEGKGTDSKLMATQTFEDGIGQINVIQMI